MYVQRVSVLLLLQTANVKPKIILKILCMKIENRFTSVRFFFKEAYFPTKTFNSQSQKMDNLFEKQVLFRYVT